MGEAPESHQLSGAGASVLVDVDLVRIPMVVWIEEVRELGEFVVEVIKVGVMVANEFYTPVECA